MKATLFSALALSALLTLTALTPPAHRFDQRGPEQPVRRKIRAYVQQNVLPSVRQQRQKLEAQLSTSDKAQLAVYRAQLHDLRQRGRELRRSFAAAPAPASIAAPTSAPALTEAQQLQLQQLRTETRALLQSVGQLAQKYDTDIARLSQELKPQKEQWATDIRAIVARAASTAPAAARRHRGGTVGRFFRSAAFLLLDPATPTQPTGRASAAPQVYPNPVAATSQLDYAVPKAGPVTVELLDGRGNTLRTVAQQQQPKGSHHLAVDVADLPAGTYFFKITTRAGAETRRFVKE
ncbi:T9SS type A sorting domain-containing protein [Hymenobacter metallilatus]|uniref:T9SS C-terminal target domain-containing protein n=1 Tax=Hymenobacter metallilatus TaxID=2493666 RepID=A0A3R9NIP5_9BACT|nr:T9SS type A sorting domain-containing protein [Hymenobacter metallilatus]RSK36198.1 T9SS C-terminal target domain-containing protein [Hymenobacter metallilatus]